MNTIFTFLFSKLLCFFIFGWLLLFSPATATGQSGARSIALAESTVADHSFWAVGGNPAGLATHKYLEAGFSTKNSYLLKELQSTEMALAFGGKPGSMAISLTRFGFSLYSENKLGLSYARNFREKISVGIELHYTTLVVGEEKLKSSSGDFNAGIIFQATSKVKIGFQAGNPGSFLFLKENKSNEIPFFRLGMVFDESKNLRILVETEKIIDQKPVWKCGLEIFPCDKFTIMTGISAPPLSISVGSGLKLHRLQIDIASSYHHVLGFSPCLSIQYSLNKCKK